MRAMDKPKAFEVELRSSRLLAGLLGIAHGGVLLLLPTLPVAGWIVVLMSGMLVISASMTITRHALRRGARTVTALKLANREQLQIRAGDGVWHGGRLLGSSTVGAAIAVLNIRLDGGGTTHVVIFGDGIDADDFRRLRVWLRWGPRPAGAETDPA
jgi:toxin CptA